jgi:H+-translocating NAD(P) transhydrogenase subunit beta
MRLSSVLTDAVIILVLFGGVRAFRSPRTARWGNTAAAAALLAAMVLVMTRHGVGRPGLVAIALLLGAAVGFTAAARVTMTQIPAMIALQHGAGGLAAVLVSLLEIWRGSQTGLTGSQALAGLLGMMIGAATFSGSMIAAAKLGGRLNVRPLTAGRLRSAVPGLFLVAGLLAFGSNFTEGGPLLAFLIGASVFSAVGGLLLATPVGGADMPVLISTLNATAGFAAAFCGVILEDRLLVAAGAMVAASGSVLTHVMCRAMNRSLLSLFTGHAPGSPAGAVPGREAMLPQVAVASAGAYPSAMEKPASAVAAVPAPAPPGPAPQGAAASPPPTTAVSVTAALVPPAEDGGSAPVDPLERAAGLCIDAKEVIVVPGYGMARAQAQFAVADLARQLEKMGKRVRFAVHPVAGRMPGHMHVLMAEADVSYDLLVEMDQINPDFEQADLALVVGACDVVNPAALSVPDCPISGMPILLAGQARRVLVCNFDDRPGYSGVENPLYEQENTTMLLGDAAESIVMLSQAVTRASSGADGLDKGPA